MKSFVVILAVIAFFLAPINATQAVPEISCSTVSDLFLLTEEYCQYKICTGDNFDKDVFKYMLDQIRTYQAIHLGVNFEEGKVWFIEPFSGIHQMTSPNSYMVKDAEFSEKLFDHFTCLNERLFSMKNNLMTVTAGELAIKFDSTSGLSPRNVVDIMYQVKVSSENDFELLEYQGKAEITF